MRFLAVVFIKLTFLICFQTNSYSKLYAQNIINVEVAQTILDSLIKFHYDCDTQNMSINFDQLENKMFYVFRNSNTEIRINKDNCQVFGLKPFKGELLLETDSIALIISEIIVSHKYGRDKILKQKPFIIKSSPESWIISGSLDVGLLGGVFFIEIQKKDCRVLKIIHEK